MVKMLALQSLYLKLRKLKQSKNQWQKGLPVRYEINISIPLHFRVKLYQKDLFYSNIVMQYGNHCNIEYLHYPGYALPDFEVVTDSYPAKFSYFMQMDIFVNGKQFISQENFQNNGSLRSSFLIEASTYNLQKFKHFT